MKLCVVSPKGCSKSAKELAEALGADYNNPYTSYKQNFGAYDGVINYGVSCALNYKNILNRPPAVARCVDKLATFNCLKNAGVSIPKFCTRAADVPADWETVVVRKTSTGRGNEGMDYVYQWKGDKPKEGVLFTEYFDHSVEYRVVVICGVVVAHYRKDEVPKDDLGNTQWDLALMEPVPEWKEIDADCIKAAAALGIDYAGFDVVENDHGKFVILEANSGPILTEEVKDYIVKQFKG